jgi:hypothetical protein
MYANMFMYNTVECCETMQHFEKTSDLQTKTNMENVEKALTEYLRLF